MTRSTGAPPLLSVFAWLAPLACSLAFLPLIADGGYVLAAAVLSLGPLAVTLGLRALGAPAGLVVTGQLVALLLWTTLLHFGDTAAGGLVPTPATAAAFGDLLAAGVETANAYAPPAPATDGLVFLVALSVTGCYLAVDGLGVGLGRVPLTGLPLLALYTVPAALAPDGVPTLAFLPGAAAFLLLLGYDERDRLGHWGRQISTITGIHSEDDMRRLNAGALSTSATRVGAVALGAAAVLPLFVPVLPAGLLDGGPGDGNGPGTVEVTNPIVDLRRDMVERSTEPAMTVWSRGSGDVSYFRLAALDEFDGERWKFSDRDIDGKFSLNGGLTSPPGLNSNVLTQVQRFDVQIAPQFHSDWLPAPYAPRRVRIDDAWRYDPTTLDIVAGADEVDAAGQFYQVTAVRARPTFDQLDTAGGAPSTVSGRYTEVPDSVPDQVRELAERITERGASRFQRAVLLQDWFRSDGGFRYSLAAPDGHSGDDILAFLNDRVGYCEQFAAAMALMARELNIPARVAVGFLDAVKIGDRPDLGAGGIYQYRFADMHAWPELYFEGAGWVRFEPTAGTRPGASAPPWTSGDATDPQQLPGSSITAGPSVSVPTAPPSQLDPGRVGTATGSEQSGSSGWLAVPVVVLGLAMLAPAALRVVLRRRRLAVDGGPAQRAEAVWAELRDSMRDLGYDWPVDSPRRTAARVLPLVRRREGAESALRRLALTVERARFAREPGDATTLEHDLRLVVDALRARESRRDLVRATLLPRSLQGRYRRLNRREVERFRNLTLDADASALQAAP
jgi:transglutaminase-like putative cysteine protease